MTENIDRYYKERLEDYVESPAPATWDNIAIRLGHDRKRKAMIVFWRIAAGMALLVTLSVLMQDSQKLTPSEIADNIDSKQQSGEEIHVAENEAALNMPTTATSGETDFITDKEAPKVIENNYTKELKENTANSRVETRDEKTEMAILTKDTDTESAISAYREEDEFFGMLTPIVPDLFNTTRPAIGESLPSNKQLNDIPVQTYTLDQLLAINNEVPAEKDNKNVWAVGGQFAPQYSYRNFVSEDYQDYVVDQINSDETPVITYAGGFNVTLSPNKRLSVQTGIHYSRYGQEQNDLVQLAMNKANRINTDPNLSYDTWDGGPESTEQLVYVGNSTGKITINNNKSAVYFNQSPANYYSQSTVSEFNAISTEKPVNSITLYYEYLEIPLNLRYKVINQKLVVSVIGGLSTNFLVGSGINLNYNDESKQHLSRSTSDLTQINYAGSVGFGMEYPLDKNFMFTVEPRFKYYLNSIDKDPLSDIHPYAFGLYTGINYRF